MIDSAIPFLGTYSREKKAYADRDRDRKVFSSFVTEKTWKQLKCLSASERINKLLYIPTTEYYLAIKKELLLPIHDESQNTKGSQTLHLLKRVYAVQFLLNTAVSPHPCFLLNLL